MPKSVGIKQRTKWGQLGPEATPGYDERDGRTSQIGPKDGFDFGNGTQRSNGDSGVQIDGSINRGHADFALTKSYPKPKEYSQNRGD